jgi:HK97 family phage major capsid protein
MDALKTKLAEAEEAISAKRDERKTLAEARDEARNAFAAVDGYDPESDEYKAAEAAAQALSVADQEIAGLETARTGILRMMAADPDAIAPVDNAGHSEPNDTWSSALLDTGAFDVLRKAAGSRGRLGQVDLGTVMSRDAFAAELGSGDVAGLIQPDRRGLVPPIFRALTLLDVMPAGTTNSNSVEYVQVTQLPESAAEVSEGTRKPEASLAFEDADAPVRTIAEWLKVRKQTLADADALRAFIDSALRYDVRRRLEGQVIAGDGVGENIAGLLEQPILQPNVSGSDADRVHNGITAVQLANHEPTVVILNPLDWEGIRLSRDDSGAAAGTGGYLFGPPSVGGAATLWGLRTVVSVVCPQGTAIVCDPNGAIVLIREGVNVLVSDADGEDFTHNRVTVLAEMRAGLVVQRPDAFAAVDLQGS